MISPFFLIALPIWFILLITEAIFSYKEETHSYSKKNLLNNLTVGVVFFASKFLSKIVMFYLFWLLYRVRVFEFSNAWYVWILAIVAVDFTFYWGHRGAHEIGWLWASHATHHSSNEFNLSVAVRISFVSNTFLFCLWMPLLGFNPIMVNICLQICMLYQTFLHTERVGKLPRTIEWLFNTPSHHRVHHSSNIEYLDKNHGGMLMVWDRIFGTYHDEDEKPMYGLTTKIENDNPATIVFSEWKKIFQKAMKSGSLKNAINYFIQPPGWSHDGSSKTVKQMRAGKSTHRKCNHDCVKCPLRVNRMIVQ